MLLQGLSALVGLWLYASPAILGLDGRAATAAYVLGALALATSALAAFDVLRGLRYVNVATGILAAVAPAVLGFGGRGLVNAVLCAAALVGLAFATPPGDVSRRGGGWSALVRDD